MRRAPDVEVDDEALAAEAAPVDEPLVEPDDPADEPAEAPEAEAPETEAPADVTLSVDEATVAPEALVRSVVPTLADPEATDAAVPATVAALPVEAEAPDEAADVATVVEPMAAMASVR